MYQDIGEGKSDEMNAVNETEKDYIIRQQDNITFIEKEMNIHGKTKEAKYIQI